jgi:hypothetical protein
MPTAPFTRVPFALVPDHFLPEIGLMMVTHAFMDREIQYTIFHLAKTDRVAGISILSSILQTSARAEILQNLALTKVRGQRRRCMLLAMVGAIHDLCKDRNIIAHLLPYSYSPSMDQLSYFRDVNTTNPQIKIQPPLNVTVASLQKMAHEMTLVGVWLSSFRGRHPDWRRRSVGRFPWPDRFRDKVQRENRRNRSSPRKRQAQRRSSHP